MATVSRLDRYVFTGGRGEELQRAELGPAGIIDDRRVVLYDPNNVGKSGGFARIGQKKYPQLATVEAGLTKSGNVWVSHAQGRLARIMTPPDGEVIYVDEFEQPTPCRDAGDFAASFFSKLVGIDVRAAVKTSERMNGEGLPPEERKTGALHLVFQESADALGLGDKVDRFRANVVIDGAIDELFANSNDAEEDLTVDSDGVIEAPPAHSEFELIGRLVLVGSNVVQINAAAPRCKQTGNDQQTGEYIGDVPQVFPQMQRDPADGRSPAFGVYGYLIENRQPGPAIIRVGDEVTLLDAA